MHNPGQSADAGDPRRVCPLCHAGKGSLFHQDRQRDYFRCSACHLIFVPCEQFLSAAEEKARYDLHRNSPDDQRYRRFLSRLFVPMHERLPAGSRGLDFGSGPGPTLSVMFEEVGHGMSIYDPFYAHVPSVLAQPYDFITATEVVEHMHQPGWELERLWGLLKPGGHFGIMTKRARDRAVFARWHYKNDPTHVCFFSHTTFAWLAAQWQAGLTLMGADVVILSKPRADGLPTPDG